MFKNAYFYIIELTMDCNIICSYCYLGKDRSPYNHQIMLFNTFKKTIDNIIFNKLLDYRTDIIYNIVLHGGEPLTLGYDKLEQYCKYIYDSLNKYNYNDRISVSIQTNGLLLNDKFIKMFNKYNINIGISYDWDNTQRNKTKNDKKIEQILYKLNGRHAVSVITKDNVNLFKNDQIKLSKPVLIQDVQHTGLSPEIDDYFDLIVKYFIDKFIKFKYFRTLDNSLNTDRYFMRALINYIAIVNDNNTTTCGAQYCGNGITTITIMPNGDIHGCDRIAPKYWNKVSISNSNTCNFLNTSQLKYVMNFYKITHTVYKEKGCDTCPARINCMTTCQSLYLSEHDKYGVSQYLCEISKRIYNYVIDNFIKIINTILNESQEEIIQFNELEIIKIREPILYMLQRNNIDIKMMSNHALKISKR